MATLISGINASMNIADGLDSDPASGSIGCDTTVTITGDADVSTVACLGSVLKSQIAGAKSASLSFSCSTEDATPYPIDLFGSTGIAVGQGTSAEIDFGDDSDTKLKVTGYISEAEYSVDATSNNTLSGTLVITAVGTWL